MSGGGNRSSRLVGAAVATVGLVLICGCSSPPAGSPDGAADPQSKVVGRAIMKDDWPLTADNGLLRCKGSGGVGQVTIEVDGRKYAVNGSAKGDKSNAAIDPIWANDTTPGLKINISPLIQEGLRLCK
jgi:hypothetical protein